MNNAKSKRPAWAWAIPVVAIAIVAAVFATTMAQASLDDSDAAKSEEYVAELNLESLSVALQENGLNCVGVYAGDGALVSSYDGLLQDLNRGLPISSYGKYYDEELAAFNDGAYDEYVRVVVNKYWLGKDGNGWKKDTSLDPRLIKLRYNTSDWIVVDEEKTGNPEQVILYSRNPVAVQTSLPFVTGLAIDPAILEAKERVSYEDGKLFGYQYDYADNKMGLDVEVSAVQTGSTADAIKSAWGIDINNVHNTGEAIVAVD